MLRTASISFATRVFSAMLNFGLIIFISRMLGPEERGICGLYLLVITIIVAISDIAGGAASSFLLQAHSRSSMQRAQMVWAILPAIAVPLIFFLFNAISLPETILLMAGGWFNSSFTMQQHLLLGLRNFTAFNFLNGLVPLLSFIFFLLIWYAGFHHRLSYLTAILVAWLVGFALGHLMIVKMDSPKAPSEPEAQISGIFYSGLINQLCHLLSIVSNRLVFFILPASTLGLWSNVLTLSEAVFLIPGSLGQIMYGFIASAKDNKKNEEYFRVAWWANLIVSVCSLIFIYFLPEAFWVMLFGKQFSGLQEMLRAIVPGMAFYSGYLLISYRQSSSGKFENNLKVLLISLFVNSSISIVYKLFFDFHLENAISALTIGWVTSFLAAIFFLKKSHPEGFRVLFTPPVKSLLILFRNK